MGSGAPRSSVISAQRVREATSDLGGAGGAVAVAVLAGLVDVEAVVGVLDGGDGEAAGGEVGDEALDEHGLAGVLPAGHAVEPHGAASASARARSSGVLTLKKASGSGKSDGGAAVRVGPGDDLAQAGCEGGAEVVAEGDRPEAEGGVALGAGVARGGGHGEGAGGAEAGDEVGGEEGGVGGGGDDGVGALRLPPSPCRRGRRRAGRGGRRRCRGGRGGRRRRSGRGRRWR